MELKILSFNDIILDSNHINVLEVEDSVLFTNIISTINCMTNEGNGKEQIVITDNNHLLNFSKDCFVIIDIFNTDLNNRKMLSKIDQNIIDILNQDEQEKYLFLNHIKEASRILENIIYDFEFDLTFNEDIPAEDFLKIMDIKIDHDSNVSLLNKICTTIEIISYFKLYKVVLIINAKLFFNDTEIRELYKYIINKNLTVLFIERIPEEKIRKYERKTKIDRDLFDTAEIYQDV